MHPHPSSATHVGAHPVGPLLLLAVPLAPLLAVLIVRREEVAGAVGVALLRVGVGLPEVAAPALGRVLPPVAPVPVLVAAGDPHRVVAPAALAPRDPGVELQAHIPIDAKLVATEPASMHSVVGAELAGVAPPVALALGLPVPAPLVLVLVMAGLRQWEGMRHAG